MLSRLTVKLLFVLVSVLVFVGCEYITDNRFKKIPRPLRLEAVYYFENKDVHNVGDLFPRRYEAYCKIFHIVYEDLSITDKDITWDEWSKANDKYGQLTGNKTTDSLIKEINRDAVIVSGYPDKPFPKKRVFWRELATRYNVEFTPDLTDAYLEQKFPRNSWPRYLIAPEEGQLDAELRWHLSKIISRVTSEFECLYYYISYRTWEFESAVYVGRIEDFADLPADLEVGDGPQYCWPRDENWCIHTDVDLEFTFIGGSKELIRKILENEIIEAVEVDPSDRVYSRP